MQKIHIKHSAIFSERPSKLSEILSVFLGVGGKVLYCGGLDVCAVEAHDRQDSGIGRHTAVSAVLAMGKTGI
jgi:hypothetical protein